VSGISVASPAGLGSHVRPLQVVLSHQFERDWVEHGERHGCLLAGHRHCLRCGRTISVVTCDPTGCNGAATRAPTGQK